MPLACFAFEENAIAKAVFADHFRRDEDIAGRGRKIAEALAEKAEAFAGNFEQAADLFDRAGEFTWRPRDKGTGRPGYAGGSWLIEGGITLGIAETVAATTTFLIVAPRFFKTLRAGASGGMRTTRVRAARARAMFRSVRPWGMLGVPRVRGTGSGRRGS